MKKIVGYVLIILFISTASIYAQEPRVSLNEIVAKMKTDLNLTDDQVEAVKPIVKESLIKRQAFLQSLEGQTIINKIMVKATLHKLRKEENEELSKVLTKEQMQKRIEKQNVKDSLNQDQTFTDRDQEEGITLNPHGGSFQF